MLEKMIKKKMYYIWDPYGLISGSQLLYTKRKTKFKSFSRYLNKTAQFNIRRQWWVLAISELRRKLVTNMSRFAFWDCFAGRFIKRWRVRAVTRVLMSKRFCGKNETYQEQSYPDRLSNARKLCSNGGFLVEEERVCFKCRTPITRRGNFYLAK